MEGLLLELNDLSRRNDELMTAKDSDLVVIRDLDQQLKDYKRKYEQAKTELRNVKGRLCRCLCPKPNFNLFYIQQPLNSSFKHRDLTKLTTNFLCLLMAESLISILPLSYLPLMDFSPLVGPVHPRAC